MNIIPVMKCKDMKESLSFYVNILDFKLVGTWPESGSPSFSVLNRGGAELNLSTHSGDRVFGNVVVIIVDDIERLFKIYHDRGLPATDKKDSPVHQGHIVQSWGTTEFYVDDPNGHTLRFIQK